MPHSYQDSTCDEVLRWTANTKIKYAPNPKRGKSYIRYAKYGKASTPVQALAFGSFPQDLLFDYEHGFIKVLGGERRKKPLELKDENEKWTAFDKKLAKMNRLRKTWTKTFEVAERLGVDRRQLTCDKVGGETTEMRADRQAAEELAKMIVADAAAKKRKINDQDVVAVLRLWGFKENTSRQNVMKPGVKYVRSDTVGLVAGYDGAVIVTAATTEYPTFCQVLSRRMSDHCPKEFGKHRFGWTSINVNANYAGSLHRDGNNEGPSFIKAFGDFKGGRLNYWGDDDKTEGPVEVVCNQKDQKSYVTMDISKSLLLFDGNRGHSVEDFTGERYSLVYFCCGQYPKANKKVREELRRSGILFPTTEGMQLAKKMLGKPRGYKKLAKSFKLRSAAKKPTARVWPQKAVEKRGVDFSTKAFREMARNKVKELGSGAGKTKECKDTKFVGYRVSYATLPDKRRRTLIHLQGVSGGERCAVIGDEDKVGSAHYVYKKAKGFTLGPALETYRMCDARAWCAKLLPKDSRQTKRKISCVRSYAKDGAETTKRKSTASTTAPLKRARAANYGA